MTDMARPQRAGAVLLTAVIFSLTLTAATGPALAQTTETNRTTNETAPNATDELADDVTSRVEEEIGTTTTATPTDSPTESDDQEDADDDDQERNESEGCDEHIDNVTAVCSYHYDEEAGEVILTLYSERPQRVTITDAGAFMAGGEVARSRETLKGRSKVRMPVTKYEGFVGVSIDTGRTLYAVPIETGVSLSAPKESDILALLAGLAVVPIGAVVVHRLREELRDDGVMRIDG